MLALVVDSSTPAVTAGLVRLGPDGLDVLAQRVTVDARAHGELLTPQLAAVLAESGVRAAELDAVVAGLGPGPFTSLRVGLVTAATMGQALDAPTYGVCSLDALAHAADDGRPLLVATDARRREVYWALYEHGRPVTAPAVTAPAVAADAARLRGAAFAVGEGAHRYADVLDLPVRDQPLYPPVASLAALVADRIRAGAPRETLTPLYLRRPDAVAAADRKSVLQ
ncbi:tRNA (adenosine(37)-N6)-threonylcarbamoyltransferase complex dimerization subunit type 1 TsaB [Pilimelia columellifera]|uniref:tRNA (Adenosine(37)-N6)-threonylcarbamoyltransferase complex dimerization subunit type 1 TsaB n=1 Tax=Pilimelia columellifera subsp. columellifera TaxID=706583 RepID=A0ABN3NEJ1_9ACTN